MRFVKKTSVTPDGEIANKQVYNIDEEQIQKEEMYDGFMLLLQIWKVMSLKSYGLTNSVGK